MELINQVIIDISEHYEHSLCRIKRIYRTPLNITDFRRHSGLHIQHDRVLSGWKPLPKEQMEELKLHVELHPEEMEAQAYPQNILKWIYSELLDWEEGYYLSRYLQEPQAVERYWLAILCCAQATGIPCNEISMVANFHAWSQKWTRVLNHSMLCLSYAA